MCANFTFISTTRPTCPVNRLSSHRNLTRVPIRIASCCLAPLLPFGRTLALDSAPFGFVFSFSFRCASGRAAYAAAVGWVRAAINFAIGSSGTIRCSFSSALPPRLPFRGFGGAGAALAAAALIIGGAGRLRHRRRPPARASFAHRPLGPLQKGRLALDFAPTFLVCFADEAAAFSPGASTIVWRHSSSSSLAPPSFSLALRRREPPPNVLGSAAATSAPLREPGRRTARLAEASSDIRPRRFPDSKFVGSRLAQRTSIDFESMLQEGRPFRKAC